MFLSQAMHVKTKLDVDFTSEWAEKFFRSLKKKVSFFGKPS